MTGPSADDSVTPQSGSTNPADSSPQGAHPTVQEQASGNRPNGDDVAKAPPWTDELAAFSELLPNARGGPKQQDAVGLVVQLLTDRRLHWAVARAFVRLLRASGERPNSGSAARAVQQSILRRAGAEGAAGRDVIAAVAAPDPARLREPVQVDDDLDDDFDDDPLLEEYAELSGKPIAPGSARPRVRRPYRAPRQKPRAGDPLNDALEAVERLRRIPL